ncbi:MAG: peptidoglycan editing factor PgeF [Burkholderiaceae bacterium]
MSPAPELLIPAWAIPATVGAAMSTRRGGVSTAPFDRLNLRPHQAADEAGTSDAPEAVAVNIAAYRDAIGAAPVFLRQVHGTAVVNLDEGVQDLPPADAAVCTRPGVACTVLVADCLPVLFTDRFGRGVAAAHACWRGVAAGVREATVRALCGATKTQPADLLAWMGPCIGPKAFEVGGEVLQAFGRDPSAAQHPAAAGDRFVYTPRADGFPRWHADLPGLARDRLQALGLNTVTASGLCTFSDPSRFFSFRRDGLTGRLAASVWRRG